MSQFSSLLTSRGGSLDKLKQALTATPGNFQRDDEGYWRLNADKAGNGAAIIRFLPAPPPEDQPFVSFFRHAFKGPNGWYIEMSRTTIDEADPLAEFNSRLWATNDAAKQDQVRKQSRKPTYVSNILVIQDKANPENEGKVFLYRYGKKIFEKLQKAVTPEYDGDTAFDPWHLIDGANFRLRQKSQGGFPNYDDSIFEAPRPLYDGDAEKLHAVIAQLKPLAEIIAPERFKSYDDLKKRLVKAFGFDTSVYLTPGEAALSGGIAPPRAQPTEAGGQSHGVQNPTYASTPASTAAPAPVAPVAPVAAAPAGKPWTPPTLNDEDDEDDDLSAFDS